MSFWYNHEASLSEMKEFSFDLPKPARRHFTQQSCSVKRIRTASNHKQPKKQKAIELKRKAKKTLMTTTTLDLKTQSDSTKIIRWFYQ
ncbi:hypothetical protein [Aeromonas jandaei]|uniref:hypothetical protein n=1 Tax=Aeromonas jandaei TaxID=650 RepID=UPI0039884E52